jgi:hypothetical protein
MSVKDEWAGPGAVTALFLFIFIFIFLKARAHGERDKCPARAASQELDQEADETAEEDCLT